jgi:antitoxin component of MazEF toxin-antitoxin module
VTQAAISKQQAGPAALSTARAAATCRPRQSQRSECSWADPFRLSGRVIRRAKAKRQERYEGTVVQVGNSRGMRLPAGFFRAHPAFRGKVQLTVVADGTVLVSAKPTSKRKPKEDEGDPVVASFLQFMDKQMTKQPGDIVAADADQLRRIGKLVEGVDVE